MDESTVQLTEGNISVSPELIRLLGKKLYSLPTIVILVRELLQNSIDAASTKIDIKLEYLPAEHKYIIECADNGRGMTDDILLNVFLSIGSSFKPDGGIGGFGIAKVSIFSCDYWRVDTGNLSIDNTLKLNRNAKPYNGTKVCCEVHSDYMQSWNEVQARLMIAFSFWDKSTLKIRFNDEIIKPYEYKTVHSTAHNFRVLLAKQITQITSDSFVIYRIRGLVQYTDYRNSFGTNVIADFNVGFKPSDNDYPFSLSRESVNNEYSSQVNSIVDSLSADKLSNKTRYESPKFLYSEYAGIKLERIRGAYFTQDDKRLGKLWNRMVKSCGMRLYQNSFVAGITMDANVKAKNDSHVIYLNPSIIKNSILTVESLVLILWYECVHELSHEDFSAHNEDFTHKFSDNAISAAIIPFSDNELMRLARYYLAHMNDVESDNGKDD